MVGSFGNVIFEAAYDKTSTFKNLKLDEGARIQTHNLINVKPRIEFMANDLKKLSLSMKLKAELGINPTERLDILRTIKESGENEVLMIGSRNLGSYCIESLKVEEKRIDQQGIPWEIDVSVSLLEYSRETYIESSTVKNVTEVNTVKNIDYETGEAV
ncbi:phage tail protein [Ilyobacter polytropus]|uniref:P2 GpU family protein n=1 Tax=Ilyobacter polytropus (strain ATCC 51220 / DSM 2926 / LMG 16218 / CuHBu1) TaxID=572544 RepID=E3HBK8_ILYPC|nr:phage tail protein [Ilyobacter polytropus]ADO83704.1 conserved hypothetical protein [Ilyobacter polytropus DSM 2926]